MRLRSPVGVPWLLIFVLIGAGVYAGVSKEMEIYYTQTYLNKAMFLKVPVRGDRQTVHVLEGGSSLDQSTLGEPLRFKVGEQVRITDLNFKDSSVEFKVSSLDTARRGTVIFRFRNPLRHSFASRPSFDAALENSFTEGLSYQEIDSAKEEFVQDQFDVLLRQFAVTTGTSVDFVLEAVTQKNPKYRQTQQQLTDVTRQVESLEAALEEARDQNGSLRKDAAKAVTDLAAVNKANQTLRGERDKIVRERAEMESKLRTLEQENERVKRQVQDVAKKLDLQTSSSSKLGQQVDSLSQVIDSMKQERDTLSGRVEGLNQSVADLTKDKGKLTSDLESTQRKNKKLRSDLNALTSNRDSLNADYLKVKRNKENLERGKAFEAAVRVERTSEVREEGTFQVSALYLLSQKIAVLEIEEPVQPDQEFVVNFLVESPDTVEFTAEEREFYETLGKAFRVGTTWESDSGQLEPVLKAGEEVQEVAPRDSAEWTWQFQGMLSEPETVSFGLRLVDVDDQVLEVVTHEFEMMPSGFFPQFWSSFSLLSLTIGLVLGIVGCVLAASVRGTELKRSGSSRGRSFDAQKKL